MQDIQTLVFQYPNETKNRILSVSLYLFAKNGIAAVSMREIAQAVGIKTASVYYYYKSKQSVVEDIFICFTNEYKECLKQMGKAYSKSESVSSILDSIFNRNTPDVVCTFVCLGMSLAVREQHNNEFANRCVKELFFTDSIEAIKKNLDILVENETIPPSFTNLLAMHYMMWIITLNDIWLSEYFGNKSDINVDLLLYDMRYKLSKLLELGV
ncbi:MAG: TetR/AcrR family transcriptional regulator [Oscillospiraceae bacterium]|nr:TetR/AcrR family transcriptional regulator [Oscillospiraceae bacterium]